MGTRPVPAITRMMAKRRIEGDCWIWTGYCSPTGYGQIGVRKRLHFVHRIAYEALVGPIPPGLTIDHLCKRRACFNPAHLEPVTQGENVRRGDSPPFLTRRTGVCRRGHAMTPENVYVHPNGGRQCRTCRALGNRRFMERRRRTAGGAA